VDTEQQSPVRRILGNVLLYVLWAATTGLAVLMLFVGRSFYLALLGVLGVGYWSWRFLDKALLILVAIGILSLVIASEAYYAHGLAKGRLLMRAARIMGIELLALSGFHLFLASLAGRHWVSAPTFLFGLLEGVVGIPLLVISLARKTPRNPIPPA
jgi:hypothetical protein